MSTESPSDTVVLTRSDHVAWVELNRPDRRNAIDEHMRRRLAHVVDEVSTDADVRVMVLTGAGTAFCAGVDLAGTPDDDTHVLLRDPAPLATALLRCTKPVVAAVNGAAVGGGFELALAAQLRVATPTARFRLSEVRIGSLPGSGGTQRLFRTLPSAVAWKVLLGGGDLDADAAARYGLVSDVFPEETFRDDVAALAARIAAAAPLSLRAAVVAGRAAVEGGLEQGLQLERMLWAFLSTTEDRAEGRAAFRDKREPFYRGR